MANDLTRRNNFLDNMMNMRNLMNDDFFSDFTPVEDHMKTDIEENDKQYQVKIDMPGFDKKDIHISYTNNILTIEKIVINLYQLRRTRISGLNLTSGITF